MRAYLSVARDDTSVCLRVCVCYMPMNVPDALKVADNSLALGLAQLASQHRS